MPSTANAVMARRLRRVLRTLALCAMAAGAWPALAQPAYPNKPVRVLVGYAAGGAVDVVARAVGQKISAALGQPVLVENKPGAGSNIAIKAAIESPPDGHTLLLAANADLVLAPIGGNFTMDPADAAFALRELIKPKMAMPIHYGANPLAKGAADEFRKAMEGASTRIFVPKPGEKLEF